MKNKSTQFQPGQSGNPAGRPVGSRNKLSEDFLSDFCAAWSKFGTEALEYMAQHEPVKLVQAAVQILPKDFQVNVSADQTSWVINASPRNLTEAQWRKMNGLNSPTIEGKVSNEPVETG